MPQYRLYISDDEDRALRAVARRTGQRPLDTLRALVQQLARDEKIAALDTILQRLAAQNEALYGLLAAVASEVGFVSGAIQFSVQPNTDMASLATSKRGELDRAAEAIKEATEATGRGRWSLPISRL